MVAIKNKAEIKMEFYLSNGNEKIGELYKFLNKIEEPVYIEDEKDTFVAMKENYYWKLLEWIARCDKELQHDVIVSLGDQIVSWEDDTVQIFEAADFLNIPAELVNSVVGQLISEVFRDYDGENSALFSPQGWEYYLSLKESRESL